MVPLVYQLSNLWGFKNSTWIAAMPLLYSGSLLVGRLIMQETIPRVEFDREVGVLRLPESTVPLSRVRAIQVIEHLKRLPPHRRLMPVVQINLVYSDGVDLERLCLVEGVSETQVIGDAKAMSSYLGVPLDENYLSWDILKPYHSSGGMWILGWLIIVVLLTVFLACSLWLSPLQSWREYRVGMGAILGLHLAGLIFTVIMARRSRRRAFERAALHAIEKRGA